MTNHQGATGNGFEERTVWIGEAALSLRIGGAGPPLVLFHSLLADASSFDPVATVLAERYQVIALNLPGFGASDAVDGGLEAVADHVAEGLARLQLAAPPVFIGNGYGGFVALLTAIRHPGLARRLVLADCGATFSEAGRAAFRGMSKAAEAGGLAAVADVAMRRLFAPEYQALHPELVEACKTRFLSLAPSTFHAACAALAALDLREHLASLTLPTLVMVGEMDEATPPPMSHELAAGLRDARLVVLPGCAHVPQLQSPELFLATLGDFIAASNQVPA